jgi:hypothetical protein
VEWGRRALAVLEKLAMMKGSIGEYGWWLGSIFLESLGKGNNF